MRYPWNNLYARRKIKYFERQKSKSTSLSSQYLFDNKESRYEQLDMSS